MEIKLVLDSHTEALLFDMTSEQIFVRALRFDPKIIDICSKHDPMLTVEDILYSIESSIFASGITMGNVKKYVKRNASIKLKKPFVKIMRDMVEKTDILSLLTSHPDTIRVANRLGIDAKETREILYNFLVAVCMVIRLHGVEKNLKDQ